MIVGFAIIGLLLLPFSWWWKGYVFVILWGWFAVPLGLTPISLHYAVGAMMIFTLARGLGPWVEDKRSSADQFASQVASAALYPALTLGGAWVWRWLQWGM